MKVSNAFGDDVGRDVGRRVGKLVGLDVGLFVGFMDIVGAIEIVGEEVGLIIGLDDGSLDGDGVGSSLYDIEFGWIEGRERG